MHRWKVHTCINNMTRFTQPHCEGHYYITEWVRMADVKMPASPARIIWASTRLCLNLWSTPMLYTCGGPISGKSPSKGSALVTESGSSKSREAMRSMGFSTEDSGSWKCKCPAAELSRGIIIFITCRLTAKGLLFGGASMDPQNNMQGMCGQVCDCSCCICSGQYVSAEQTAATMGKTSNGAVLLPAAIALSMTLYVFTTRDICNAARVRTGTPTWCATQDSSI